MKKRASMALCLLAASLLPGCWSRLEPKNLAIINSVVYDIKDDGMYEVTVEYMNPSGTGGASKGSSSNAGPNITEKSQGLSPREALGNAAQTTDMAIFAGHNEVRFMTEAFARHDMIAALDYFARDHLTDLTSLIVVLQGQADTQKLYAATQGLSETVGGYIANLNVYQPKEISKGVFVTTMEFLRDYFEDGKEPVAGTLTLEESSMGASSLGGSGGQQSQGQGSQNQNQGGGQGQKYKIVFEGLAAFKGGKLAGFMNGIEARAYNILVNAMETALVSVPTGEDFTVFQITSSSASLKPKVENGQISLGVSVSIKATILAEGSSLDITQPAALRTVEKGLEDILTQEISATIQKAQKEFQSDIFGFGKAMHAKYPTAWKTVKDHWDEYFAAAPVSVTVKVDVDRTGQLKEPVRMEELE